MNKNLISILFTIIIIVLIVSFTSKKEITTTPSIATLSGTIINKDDDNITIEDNKQNYYTFKSEKIKDNINTEIKLNCLGKLNDNKDIQDCKIIDYEVTKQSNIPENYLDNGIFSNYYHQAFAKLMEMSQDEVIAQLLLIHYNDSLEIQKIYQFGGFIFYEKDFKDKSKDEVIKMISDLQNSSKIPLLTAIDEEGGSVSRISSNKNLVATPFLSSQELYNLGGFQAIYDDVINKSQILKELGLNLNLAPVVDVSQNVNDYIYKRSFGQNTELTSIYSKTVIEASKKTDVSYTLKHFPGYGNNLDTHKSSSIDSKSYEDIEQIDLPPFIEGIKAGAEAVMNSHNIVQSIDANNPASLSLKIHQILRNDLNFTGIIIADDLDMGALKDIENVEIKALMAGNNILITSNYEKSFKAIKDALNNNLIDKDIIYQSAFKILAWKYYKGLIN